MSMFDTVMECASLIKSYTPEDRDRIFDALKLLFGIMEQGDANNDIICAWCGKKAIDPVMHAEQWYCSRGGCSKHREAEESREPKLKRPTSGRSRREGRVKSECERLANDGSVTPKGASDLIGCSYKAASQALSRLEKEGRIRRLTKKGAIPVMYGRNPPKSRLDK